MKRKLERNATNTPALMWVFCTGVRDSSGVARSAHELRTRRIRIRAAFGLCKRVRFLRGLRIWVEHEVIVYNESALNRWADVMRRSTESTRDFQAERAPTATNPIEESFRLARFIARGDRYRARLSSLDFFRPNERKYSNDNGAPASENCTRR